MMQPIRLAASSYSNTAPLIWSFLYGSNHGKVELVLDNAPARSAELLTAGRVDAALVPVIVSQLVPDLQLVPSVCVGARENVRSVCLVTHGKELAEIRSVALDISSKTSVALTKIIFREFIGFDPVWNDAEPDLDEMLSASDAALIIGDPALAVSNSRVSPAGRELRTFDLVELWRKNTGFGFVFAMWMTRRRSVPIDFAAARDEGLAHLSEIAANYAPEIGITQVKMQKYLAENISYKPDRSMLDGMKLYFELAAKCRLTPALSEPAFLGSIE